jgi:hypothetical protein
MSSRFIASDAWIFISLNPGGAATALDDLLATADWINHAIPSLAEIEGAVNRLAQAGLVRAEAEKLYLTESGVALYCLHSGKRPAMLTLWKKIETHLNTADLPVLALAEFQLSQDQYAQACQRYHARWTQK